MFCNLSPSFLYNGDLKSLYRCVDLEAGSIVADLSFERASTTHPNLTGMQRHSEGMLMEAGD